MKRTRTGRLKKRSLLWRLRRPVLVLAVLGVVLTSSGAYALWNSTDLPDKDPPLRQTSFICADDVAADCNQDNSMAQLSGAQSRVTVTYDQIPPVFIEALLSAEDKDFFKHPGVDPTGVARALVSDLRNEKANQGGSTITQQYVKNVYLNNELTLTRKLQEAVMAIKLDRELPKQEILERYLNTIYFGRNAYGIEAAAQAYFGKHVEQLGLPESAFLAGIVRQPEDDDPSRLASDPLAAGQRRNATDRRRQVLDAMLEQGYITKAARDQVAAMGWEYVVPRQTTANNGTVKHPELGTDYFVDYVHHWLVSSGLFTDSQLYGGGLRIYTTLDYTAQSQAYQAIGSVLNRPGDPTASIVSIDDQGRVKAMVGGFDYKASQVNLAVGTDGGGSGRQPGSSFKPLVLAQYLSEGKSLGQTYNAPSKLVLHPTAGGAPWQVANYGDESEGDLNVVDATKFSSNTAYAQIMEDTGVQDAADMAKRLGVTAPLDAVPSLVLGTSDVSVLDMASAYSTFADEGDHIGPFVVTKVTNADGEVLYRAPTDRTPVLDKNVADTVNWVLSQVVQGGTGTGAQFGQPLAGKTGTTEDYHDAWFVGYTCKLTTAVWVGYPNEPGQKPKDLQGVHGINVTGGTLPASIFSTYMGHATQGLSSCAFNKPPNVNVAPSGTIDSQGSVPANQGTSVASTTVPGTAPKETTSTVAPPTSTPASTAVPTTTAPPRPTTTVPVATTTAVPTTVAPPVTTVP
jgi:penicillin-binding protein 1A